MTELKTLKDFGDDINPNIAWCSLKDVKAEAVKWIKLEYDNALKKSNKTHNSKCDGYGTTEFVKGCIYSLRKFLDITEEDLQEDLE